MRTVPLALAVTLALSACAPVASTPPETADTYGATAGAVEVTEAVLQAATVDSGGELSLQNLVTEERQVLSELDGVSSMATDGRYLFVSTPEGVTVADSGAWTVPHGDHFHYYVAEPRVLGVVAGTGPVVVHSSTTVTALWFGESGEGVILDGEALGDGELVETARVRAANVGVLVPFGEFLLAGRATGSVEILDHHGQPVDAATAACAELDGSIVTRVGVVFGCADGALLATLDPTGSVVFESIPYPFAVSSADRARSFAQRPGRPAVAAPAGSTGAWLLDTRAREWSFLASVPLVAAVAVDDDTEAVVAIAADGRVIVLGPTPGSTTPILASSLANPALAAGVTLHVDADRAYVNAPADSVVYEIDFADGARIARQFPVEALFLAETGR